MKKVRLLFILTILVLVLIRINYINISNVSKNHLYDDILKVPSKKVGLVLGTSKYTNNNKINAYYYHRLNAAYELYKNGKIEYILISGDNSRKSYDEPTSFKEDLIKKGVLEDKIFLDYAGFRTLDSITRAKEVFMENDFIIISQKFHNERAYYIASKKGINAICYNAKDVNSYVSVKVIIREHLSRVKLIIDVLFDVKPKFLGEKIKIGG